MELSIEEPVEEALGPSVRWLSVEEVAAEVRLSRVAVLNAIHRGSLPALRLGKEYRVRAGALRESLLTGTGQH